MSVKASTIQCMDNQPVRWRTVGIALGATALVAFGGLWAANTSGILAPPAVEPTAVVQEESSPTPTLTATPTPTPTVEPVAEAPAPVEEAPAPEPAGPDLCPAGTQSQSSDGYNDLSCAPDVCLTIRGIPDPQYPECDYFYPPSYYR